MLLMTASNAGYIACNLPWLVVMMLYIDWEIVRIMINYTFVLILTWIKKSP